MLAALQQDNLGLGIMSALLGVVAFIYGLSLTVALGGSVLLTVSPRFKRLLIGETPAR